MLARICRILSHPLYKYYLWRSIFIQNRLSGAFQTRLLSYKEFDLLYVVSWLVVLLDIMELCDIFAGVGYWEVLSIEKELVVSLDFGKILWIIDWKVMLMLMLLLIIEVVILKYWMRLRLMDMNDVIVDGILMVNVRFAWHWYKCTIARW